MQSRFFYVLIIAALWASHALAADHDAQTVGATPMAKMENADKNAGPDAPPDESRVQIPDLPHPTGEKPPAKNAETPKPADTAQTETAQTEHVHAAEHGAPSASLRIALTPASTLEKGKPASFRLSLYDQDDKAVAPDDLDTPHTRKIHLLIIDESLSDYQHVHPKLEGNDWLFSFTPATGHNYRIWVDIKPKGSGQQLIPLLLKGKEPCDGPCVDKSPSTEASFGDNKAALSLDGPLKAGTPANVKLSLTGPDGAALNKLEPVMGAYAHVAAFTDDLGSVAHVHPMGAEPQKDDDRGTSPLSFMLHPAKPGTLKLFVQIGREGKDIFLPFTLTVGDEKTPPK